MATIKSHHNLDRPSDHCGRLTALIYGEGCDDLTMAQTIGTWTAFTFLLVVMIFTFFCAMSRLLPYLFPNYFPQSSTSSVSLRGGALQTKQCTIFERMTAFSYGGMDKYQELLRSEERDRMVREKAAREGWAKVEIPIIQGWNDEEARRKERRQAERLIKGLDEEEAAVAPYGEVSPSRRGTQLSTLGFTRGGHLVEIPSDEEDDKEMTAKSFGKGSSNSRQRETKNLSQRKR